MPKTHPNGKPRGNKLDEDGGETISVEIKVNGIRSYYRLATITGGPTANPNAVRRYTTDNGQTIMHNRNSGIKSMAKKLIDL